MGRRKRRPLPAIVSEVASRIEHWRETRAKRSPMPAELWEEATELARVHGAYPISQELHLNYMNLRKRAEAASEEASAVGVVPTGFVEVSTAQLLSGPEGSQTKVEMVEADGTKVVVRLPSRQRLDVERLVETFWRRRT